jgi:hypothetical protein
MSPMLEFSFVFIIVLAFLCCIGKNKKQKTGLSSSPAAASN